MQLPVVETADIQSTNVPLNYMTPSKCKKLAMDSNNIGVYVFLHLISVVSSRNQGA